MNADPGDRPITNAQGINAVFETEQDRRKTMPISSSSSFPRRGELSLAITVRAAIIGIIVVGRYGRDRLSWSEGRCLNRAAMLCLERPQPFIGVSQLGVEVFELISLRLKCVLPTSHLVNGGVFGGGFPHLTFVPPTPLMLPRRSA